MKYDFDEVVDRRNTESVKWDMLNATFDTDDVLPMWVADMDFPIPQEIVDAVSGRAKHPVYGYTQRGRSYYETIRYWLKTKHNWDIKKEWLASTPGVVSAIAIAVNAFTEPGDKVLVQPPVYHPFYTSIEGNGRKLVTNPLKNNDGFYTMDFEDMEEKLKNGVKMFVLCSPHNPVGRVWNKDELTKVSELCLKYNVLMISDEIHSDLVYGGCEHISAAAISEDIALNTITCMAPSKTFNIAGLCTSYVIIPDEKKHEQFDKKVESLGIGTGNVFGITALEEAYLSGEEWLTEILQYLDCNADYLTDFINRRINGIKVRKPQGTYLAWLDCRDLGLSNEKLKNFFVYKAKVGLNEGIMFGPEGEGFFRLNFGCPRSILKEGLERIEKAAEKLK